MPQATESTRARADARLRPAEPARRRLNWGCGAHVAAGWINSDVKDAPEVDLVADIKRGLPLPSGSIDCAVSVHALPELSYRELLPALTELRRVLRVGGVLRLALPDLDRAIAAYAARDDAYFHLVADDASTPGGRLITQMLWYGYSRTLFTADFAVELLEQAGYAHVTICRAHETASEFPEIVELDNREEESFYVEASNPSPVPAPRWRPHRRGAAVSGALEVLDVSLASAGEGQAVRAAHLDGPVRGMRVQDGPLRVVGWAVGERAPVREVEVVCDGEVVGRASVDVARPRVAERFAGVAGAERAGFDLGLEPSGRGISELAVEAVLGDGSRAPLATVRVDVQRRRALSRLFR